MDARSLPSDLYRWFVIKLSREAVGAVLPRLTAPVLGQAFVDEIKQGPVCSFLNSNS